VDVHGNEQLSTGAGSKTKIFRGTPLFLRTKTAVGDKKKARRRGAIPQGNWGGSIRQYYVKGGNDVVSTCWWTKTGQGREKEPLKRKELSDGGSSKRSPFFEP